MATRRHGGRPRKGTFAAMVEDQRAEICCVAAWDIVGNILATDVDDDLR
jgi:hypothetical protein